VVALDELFTRPRRGAASYGEVLPWFGLATDQVVICHDGSLLCAFAYEGADIEGVLDEEANRRINLLQTALKQLNDRITLWSVLERRFETRYPRVVWTNPVAARIDADWADQCAEAPNATLTHRLYLGYSFPSRAEAFFERWRAGMERDERGLKAVAAMLRSRFGSHSAVAQLQGQLGEMVEEFEATLAAFSEVVVASLGFERLAGPHLVGDLYGRANLASPKAPVALPDRPVYLNLLLPADDLVRQGDLLEFRGPGQDVYCAALSTTGMPPEAYSLQIDRLLALPCEYVLVQTFRFLDSYVAEKAIQAAEQFYRTEVKSAAVRLFERITGIESDKINTGHVALAEDAQAALVELTAGSIGYGYYNMTLLALGASAREANRGADLIAGALRAAGFTITRERLGLMPAFLGSLPGNSRAQLRRYLASTANLADLAPIRTVSRGEPRHALFSELLAREVPAHVRFMTPYGVPYDFNTHVQDLGHAVVIGGSGSGKSIFLSLLTAQFQKFYPCQAFIFDKDHSMALLTTLLGGACVDMANPLHSGVRINPVRRMLSDQNERALLRWLDILLSSQEEPLRPEDKERLSDAIQGLRGLGEAHWRLSTLFSLLNGSNKRLAARLAPFVDRSEREGSYARGAYSEFFDNDEDAFSLASLVALETGRLLQIREVAAPFMEYAFYCIEARLDGRTPTMLYIEESWYMLANPIFEAKINDWLRTFRKKRAFVVFATQSPEELQRLKSWAAFVSNVPTRIFLPSLNDSVSATAPILRELFNLNDAQLELLAAAVPKRDYLLVKPGMTRLVQATMPRVLVAINEATVRADRRQQAEAAAQSGAVDWQSKYLEEVLHV
jgi:type IV secretion/conjugal transfer VirB4 family ATPase